MRCLPALAKAWEARSSAASDICPSCLHRKRDTLHLLQKKDLSDAFVGINLSRKWCGVGNFKCNVTLPFGLKGSYVDNYAAARIGAFAQADGENGARDAEIFHGARKDEGIGRDDADISFEIDH